MDKLPRDILFYLLFPKLPLYTIFSLQFVCRHLRSAVQQSQALTGRKRLKILQEAVEADVPRYISWIFSRLAWKLLIAEVEALLEAAARSNSIKMLEKILLLSLTLEDSVSLFFPIEKKRTIEEILSRLNVRLALWIAAVKSGSLRIVNWLYRNCAYENIKGSDERIAAAAAERGDVEMIEFLEKKKIRFIQAHWLSAAEKGHCDAVQYFYRNSRLIWNPAIQAAAFRSRSKPLIEWVLSQSWLRLSSVDVGAVAVSGDAKLLEELISRFHAPLQMQHDGFANQMYRVHSIPVLECLGSRFGMEQVARSQFESRMLCNAPMETVFWCIEKGNFDISSDLLLSAFKMNRLDVADRLIELGAKLFSESSVRYSSLSLAKIEWLVNRGLVTWEDEQVHRWLAQAKAWDRIEWILKNNKQKVKCACNVDSSLSCTILYSGTSSLVPFRLSWSLIRTLVSAGHQLHDSVLESVLTDGPLALIEWLMDCSDLISRGLFLILGKTLRVDVMRILVQRNLPTRKIILRAINCSNWPLIVWASRNSLPIHAQLILKKIRHSKDITERELFEMLEHSEDISDDAENDA